MIEVPEALTAIHGGDNSAGRDWIASLPRQAADFLDRWELRLDGPVRHGMAALVLPVTRGDGLRAVLKLQQVTPENADTAAGLRAWNGAGIVQLLDYDPASRTQLLERLEESRSLSSVDDDDVAMGILADILNRLVAVKAPAGTRRLADIATTMLEDALDAVHALRTETDRALVRTCAAAVRELIDEAGDQLLHWDLHYDNILAGTREPWLAIDPEPLAGDPGFDLWPALDSRREVVTATGDPAKAILRRFDLLTETLGLDRQRATGWTLGRVLQNALWDIEDGKTALEPAQIAIVDALLNR